MWCDTHFQDTYNTKSDLSWCGKKIMNIFAIKICSISGTREGKFLIFLLGKHNLGNSVKSTSAENALTQRIVLLKVLK